ncbi:MAG: M28 family metallopeptidase [Nitriliruptorales bacterium]
MRGVRWGAIVAVGLVLATACSAPAPLPASAPPPPVESAPSPSPLAGEPVDVRLVEAAAPRALGRLSIDPGRALAHVVALADIGPRLPGSEADRAARGYVSGIFEAADWSVVEEPFGLPQGGESANVVAWRSGAEPPYGGPHVVIGGHLDTVEGSPGANDNASGVGVILAVAEALGPDVLPALPVVLVAFGAEERQPAAGRPDHVGSDAYASAHGERVVAMLSVDMIGNGRSTCMCWYAAGPGTLAERLAAVAGDAGIDAVHVARQGDVSDHGPFALRGVPAAFLWTGIDSRYHSPGDTAEHVRPADLARAGALLLAFLADLTSADATSFGSG